MNPIFKHITIIVTLIALTIILMYLILPSKTAKKTASHIQPIPIDSEEALLLKSVPGQVSDWSQSALLIPQIHAQPGLRGAGAKIGIADYTGYHGDVVTYTCRRIAPDAEIVFRDLGNPADGAAAIRFLADQGCHVINCSWYSESYWEPLDQAIRYAVDRGCVVVFGAGNAGHGLPPYWPSSMHTHLPGVIQVGSYNQFGQVSSFSNGGINVQCTFPGEDLLVPGLASGTSLAAPGVSGVIALGIGWRSANNKLKLTPAEIYWLIGPNLTTSRCIWPGSFLSAIQWAE